MLERYAWPDIYKHATVSKSITSTTQELYYNACSRPSANVVGPRM